MKTALRFIAHYTPYVALATLFAWLSTTVTPFELAGITVTQTPLVLVLISTLAAVYPSFTRRPTEAEAPAGGFDPFSRIAGGRLEGHVNQAPRFYSGVLAVMGLSLFGYCAWTSCQIMDSAPGIALFSLLLGSIGGLISVPAIAFAAKPFEPATDATKGQAEPAKVLQFRRRADDQATD